MNNLENRKLSYFMNIQPLNYFSLVQMNKPKIKTVPDEMLIRKCCFCDTTDRKLFKEVSHLIPEGLGNKEIISLEECDICNHNYAKIDGAISNYLSPSRTFFGVYGKKGLISFHTPEFSFNTKKNILNFDRIILIVPFFTFYSYCHRDFFIIYSIKDKR